MKMLHLVLKEIAYHKVNFCFSLLAVLVAVTLFVVFLTSGEAYRNETRKIQLAMGQNLRIIPRETSMDRFWSTGFSEYTMPEEYVNRFAALDDYEYTHLTATLHRAIQWNEKEFILTGILPEVMPPGRNQAPMMFSVERGEVYLGFEVARMLAIEPGQEVEILGQRLRAEKCLSPTGSSDDIRIYGHLHDVQSMLGLNGRINEIKALECLCLIEAGETDLPPLALAEKQLAEIMPEGKVLLLKGISDIRQLQRSAMEGYLGLILPIVVIACGIWVGVLALMNVRQRQEEVGILRALGYSSGGIAILFLGRSVLIGLLGAVIGYFIGTALALGFGPEIFTITAGAMQPDFRWLLLLLILAPVFSAIASFIPAAMVVTLDPASTLRKA